MSYLICTYYVESNNLHSIWPKVYLRNLAPEKAVMKSTYPIPFRIKTILSKFGIEKPRSVLLFGELEKRI